MLYSAAKLPSVHASCCPRMYVIAACALQLVAPATPVMSAGVISPNSTRSFSVCTMCSICSVRVPVSYWMSALLTCQMIPAPGSSSSSTHAPTGMSVSSGPTVQLAVLLRSSRVRLIVSSRNASSASSSCPLCIGPFSIFMPSLRSLPFSCEPPVAVSREGSAAAGRDPDRLRPGCKHQLVRSAPADQLARAPHADPLVSVRVVVHRQRAVV